MHRVGRRLRRDDAGFGLVEVMLSLSVLLVVLVASSYLVDNVVQQAATSREKVAATELAEQWLEQLSNAPIASLQAYIAKDVQLTPSPVVVASVPFTVWGHLEWGDTGATHSLCTSGNPPQVIRATVTVKWAGQALGETTIINPPYGTVVPGDGFLSIQIVGLNSPNPPADTANLINVPVTVTPSTSLTTGLTSGASVTQLSVAALTSPVSVGDSVVVGTGSSSQTFTVKTAEAAGQTAIPVNTVAANAAYVAGTSVSDTAWGSATYNPDQYGCVYLLEPIGSYTVTLASPAGGPTFIDYQENLTPASPVEQVAVSGLPAFVPTFHFDEDGTVALSPSAGAPIAVGMPISVSNGSNLLAGGISTVVPAGNTATSATLFPYSSAYSVWYGDCSAVSGKPTMEEPTTPATVSITPRGSSAVSITGLVTLSLAVTQTGGGALSPTATATVADPNAATDGCASARAGVGSNGEVYTLTGLSGSGTAYSDQTAILPQTYTVLVTDRNKSQSTSTTMVVGSNGAVTVGSTTYNPGQSVPVTVP